MASTNEEKKKYHMLFDIFSIDDLVEVRSSVFSPQVVLLHGLSV